MSIILIQNLKRHQVLIPISSCDYGVAVSLRDLEPLSYHQIIWLSAQYTSFLWLALGLSYSSTKPLGRNLSYLQGFRCKRYFGIAKVPIQRA